MYYSKNLCTDAVPERVSLLTATLKVFRRLRSFGAVPCPATLCASPLLASPATIQPPGPCLLSIGGATYGRQQRLGQSRGHVVDASMGGSDMSLAIISGLKLARRATASAGHPKPGTAYFWVSTGEKAQFGDMYAQAAPTGTASARSTFQTVGKSVVLRRGQLNCCRKKTGQILKPFPWSSVENGKCGVRNALSRLCSQGEGGDARPIVAVVLTCQK